MAYKVFENGFAKGWNQDVDPRFQENASYRNPINVSVTAEGDFYSCKNISGNVEVSEFIDSALGGTLTHINVLGAFPVVGTYNNGVDKNLSIIYFVRSESPTIPGGHDNRIIMYNIVLDTSTTLLTTNPTQANHLNFPKEGTIDAVVFGENNIDKVYFDDHTNVLRKIDAVDTVITNPKEVTAVPYAPIDPISYVTQEFGSGQLSSGTYQIGYRYFNTETKKYTRWSLFTNPIPVFPLDFSDVDSLDEIYGGVANEATKKSIIVSIDKTLENSDIFNSIQLGVVKNTSGNTSTPLIGYVTTPSTQHYDDPSKIVYDGGGLETTLDIGEFGIDDACFSAKTLVSKDNVLFRGNLKYHDRLVESFTYEDAKTIKEQLGLSGSVFLPQAENITNPNINFLGTITSGQTSLTEHQTSNVDVPSVTNARIYDNTHPDFDLIEDGINTSELKVGSSVFNDFGNTESLFSITNVRPGNIIAFTFKGYRAGLREASIFGSITEQYKFRQDYLNNSINSFGLGDPEQVSSIGMQPDLAVLGYRYIVQLGETEADVVKNIAQELNTIFPNDKAEIEVISGTNQFRILSKYQRSFNGGIQREEFGLLDVLFWTERGINLTVSQTQAALDDLVTNPESKQGGYKNPRNVVKAKSYFREEVYRYGITWVDEFGCWSQPLPFDFSSKNARVVTSYGNSINLSQDIATNVRRIRPVSSSLGFSIGDYVGIQNVSDTGANNDIAFLEITEIFSDGSIIVNYKEDQFPNTSLYNDFIAGNTTVSTTLGGEYSHATSGVDWKFPSRENAAFPMMSAYDENTQRQVRPEDGFIQPIGLHISGIGGHPEWAKAFAIVRVRRLQNIVWQSPLINTIVVMPSVFPQGESFCTTKTAGNDPIGAFGPKVLTKGISRNIVRDSAKIDIQSISRISVQTKENNNVLPIVYCVPPEYMMTQDGINFEPIINPAGSEIKVVDAVSVFRTPRINVDGTGADDGGDASDQMAFALRGDTPYNYYYRQHSFSNPSVNDVRYSMRNPVFQQANVDFPENNVTRVLDFGEVTNRGEQYTFPTNPAAFNFILKRIDKWGLQPASFDNCSSEVIQQKGLPLLVNDKFGDFTMLSKQPSVTGVTTADTFLNFNIGTFSSSRMNCGESCYSALDGVSYDGTVTNLQDGSCSVLPIVNLTRGLSDDRYGLITDVHQYIFTGTYVRLDGSQTYDVNVWGGDCFIEKASIKIADTSIETNAEIPDTTNNYGIVAYDDHQEILQVYLESRVNVSLQASPFIYPVRDTRSLGEFAIDYSYPYNFGYSIENGVKVWTSRSVTEENRLLYPSRIIFSDQKVFQTDVEGFDRYRVGSTYDMPEDYESITKLTILSNGNVYCIQESGVSVIPINKNVVEQSDGSQMIINNTTLINNPQFLMTKNGSQHIRSVNNSADYIYFLDANKREAFTIGGPQGGKISELGLHSEFLVNFESFSGISDIDIVSGYDFNNEEYWIGINGYEDAKVVNDTTTLINRDTFLFVWSEKAGYWRSKIEINPATKILDVVYSKSELYILGKKENNSYVVEEVYTGDVKGQILGSVNPSEVTVVINPERNLGKTFDVLRIDSNERVDNVEITVEKENGTTDQVTLMNANISPRHDGYEFPVLYDSNGARMRGKYALARIIMNNGDNREVRILSLSTKYRLSARVFR